MTKKTVIAAVLIFLLLIGVGYFVIRIPQNPYTEEETHWVEVMKNISSLNMKESLLGHFNEASKNYLTGNFSRVLVFLRVYVSYTREDFPRSEDPEWIIFGLHLGRCGEFSIAYTALCLAFDVPARLTVHMGQDHMWTEVYVNGTWTHIDPTEGKINTPLLYNTPKPNGWGKPVGGDYPVRAFETDGSIIDVSETYIYDKS